MTQYIVLLAGGKLTAGLQCVLRGLSKLAAAMYSILAKGTTYTAPMLPSLVCHNVTRIQILTAKSQPSRRFALLVVTVLGFPIISMMEVDSDCAAMPQALSFPILSMMVVDLMMEVESTRMWDTAYGQSRQVGSHHCVSLTPSCHTFIHPSVYYGNILCSLQLLVSLVHLCACGCAAEGWPSCLFAQLPTARAC